METVLRPHGFSTAAVAWLAAYIGSPGALTTLERLLVVATRASFAVGLASWSSLHEQQKHAAHQLAGQQQQQDGQVRQDPPAAATAVPAQAIRDVQAVGMPERLQRNMLDVGLLLTAVLQQQQQQQQQQPSSTFAYYCDDALMCAHNAFVCLELRQNLLAPQQPAASRQISSADSNHVAPAGGAAGTTTAGSCTGSGSGLESAPDGVGLGDSSTAANSTGSGRGLGSAPEGVGAADSSMAASSTGSGRGLGSAPEGAGVDGSSTAVSSTGNQTLVGGTTGAEGAAQQAGSNVHGENSKDGVMVEVVSASSSPSVENAAEAWVDCMLPVLMQLLCTLQQQQQQQQQRSLQVGSPTLSSSSSATNLESSSGSGGGGTSAQTASVPRGGRSSTEGAINSARITVATTKLVQLLCIAAKTTYRKLPKSPPLDNHADAAVSRVGLSESREGGGLQAKAFNVALPLCWQTHQLELSAALDGAFRALAPAVSDSACTAGITAMLASCSRSLFGSEHGVLPLLAQVAGPGSQQELQLFSGLVSFLKLAAMAAAEGVSSGNQAIWGAAGTATDLLGFQAGPASVTRLSDPAPPIVELVPAATAAAAETGTSNSASSGLRWLWLFGRCCLLWVAQLRHLQQQYSGPGLGQRLMQLQPLTGAGMQQQAAAILGVDQWHAAIAVFGALQFGLEPMRSDCAQWLTRNNNAAKLAADGYPTGALLQQLESVTKSAAATVAAESPEAAAEAYSRTVRQLEEVGFACQSLAIPQACNNPYCSNMHGATETETVSGRSCMCGGCKVAHYCCRVCQKQHWKQHKPVCTALAAARAK